MFPHFSKRLHTFPKLALLINRNYTLLWLGGTISQIGDVLFTMMLILWVGTLLQNQSAAPLAVSGVVLAAALPALLRDLAPQFGDLRVVLQVPGDQLKAQVEHLFFGRSELLLKLAHRELARCAQFARLQRTHPPLRAE